MIVNYTALSKIIGRRHTWVRIVKLRSDLFKELALSNSRNRVYETLLNEDELRDLYSSEKTKAMRAAAKRRIKI